MKPPKFIEELYRVPPSSDRQLKRLAKLENERRKFVAGTLNSLALLFLGAFLISPFVKDGDVEVVLKLGTWIWILVAVVLHCLGHVVLNSWESEELG